MLLALYGCRFLRLWGETDNVSSYDIHVGRPTLSGVNPAKHWEVFDSSDRALDEEDYC